MKAGGGTGDGVLARMDVTIKVLTNGPYLVSGPIALSDADGNAIEVPPGRTNVALCRCGGSVNKPFCDGTHSKIGFDGAAKAVAESG
jgi:CDGSH-type Zn-finger protein